MAKTAALTDKQLKRVLAQVKTSKEQYGEEITTASAVTTAFGLCRIHFLSQAKRRRAVSEAISAFEASESVQPTQVPPSSKPLGRRPKASEAYAELHGHRFRN